MSKTDRRAGRPRNQANRSAWPTHLSRRGKRERADPSPLPVPQPLRWVPLILGVVAVLGYALWYLGADEWPPPSGFDWLPMSGLFRLAAGFAAVVTTGPGAGLPIRLAVAVLIILLLACLGKWRNASVARSPGPVDVQMFDDGTEGGKPSIRELRSALCKQLAETRLYPPQTGAGEPVPQDFLNVVRPGGEAPSGPWEMISAGFKMLIKSLPRSAYKVSGTVLLRDQAPRYGIAVTVTSLAQAGRSATTTVWGASWEDANCRVGYWVMATILPVTKLVKTAPWKAWEGRALPYELFQAYNEGKRNHDGRQFDMALWWYGAALKADPMNLELRLLVADVLEQMGLYLEALDVYHGGLVCDDEGRGVCGQFRTWRWDGLRRALTWVTGWLRCRWDQRPDLKLRYRYAMLLATSEHSVWEWFVPDAQGERERVRKQIKDRLTGALVDKYSALAEPFLHKNTDASHWLRTMLRGSWEYYGTAVQAVFRLAAMWELEELRRDVRALWMRDRGRTGGFTKRGLRLTCDVLVPLRVYRVLICWQEKNRNGVDPSGLAEHPIDVGSPLRPFVRRMQKLLAVTDDGRGERDAPTADRLAAILDEVFGHRLSLFLWPLTYADHYVAACVYSVALGWEGADVEREAERARQAVRHLRAALAATEGPAATTLQDWLLGGDPDLAWLRRRTEFSYFEQELFPRPGLVAPRPERLISVCSRVYARQLVCEAAILLERQWHDNGRRGGDIHDLVGWLAQDTAIWELLKGVADDRAYYWYERAQLICRVREFVDPVALASANFPPVFPPFEQVVMPDQDDGPGRGVSRSRSVDEVADDYRQEEDRLLSELMACLAAFDMRMSDHIRAEAEHLARRDDGPKWSDFHKWCTARAMEWQRVAAYMRTVPLRADKGARPDPLRP